MHTHQIHPIHDPVRAPTETIKQYRKRQKISHRIVSQYIRYRGRDAIEINELKKFKQAHIHG